MSHLGAYLAARGGATSDDFSPLLDALWQALDGGDTLLLDPSLRPPQAPALYCTVAAAKQGAMSPIVGNGKAFWLYALWQTEWRLTQALRARLAKKMEVRPTLSPALLPFAEGLDERQEQALRLGLDAPFLLLTGGPGTGKTHTIARLVQAFLHDQPGASVALCAPTGKAAQRLNETLLGASGALAGALDEAKTLHRLLGITQDGWSAGVRLPYDLVIVDEASMLSLELAGHLFAALAPQSRLILVGDAQQLAAVDPGAVLHDLAHHPQLAAHRVALVVPQRFHRDSGIARLEQALARGDSEQALSLLRQPRADLHWQRSMPELAALFAGFLPLRQATAACDGQQGLADVFTALDAFRVLTATRVGPFGAEAINTALHARHRAAGGHHADAILFHGLPLMMLRNDYALGVFNGDTGICLEHDGDFWLHFPGKPPLRLARLSPQQYTYAYALTVHKAQGSEFEHALLLAPETERALPRELLYTAATRARKKLTLCLSEHTLRASLAAPTKRSTGMGLMLSDKV